MQGIDFIRRSTRPFIPRSSVRRRAMFLVVDKANLSDEGEQKCGKMFNCSSRIKRRVERRNEQLNLLPRLRHTLSRTQKLVLFSKPSQYSQHSQASLIPISSKWEQSIFKNSVFHLRINRKKNRQAYINLLIIHIIL